MVASRPLTGDAVTVTVIPAGTQSSTACSVPLAGNTSYRGPGKQRVQAAHSASSTSEASACSSRDTPISTRVSGSPNIPATRSASAASAGVGCCASQTSRR